MKKNQHPPFVAADSPDKLAVNAVKHSGRLFNVPAKDETDRCAPGGESIVRSREVLRGAVDRIRQTWQHGAPPTVSTHAIIR